jgi:hypothetical protein
MAGLPLQVAWWLLNAVGLMFSVMVACWCGSSWVHAGGGPAAAHFSCSAKKSEQKKAAAKPLPLRGSRLQHLKTATTSYAEFKSQTALPSEFALG